MKIATSELNLHSDHVARQYQHSTENLRAWRGQRPDFEGRGERSGFISPAARQALANELAVPPAPTSARSAETQAIDSAREAVENDPFILLIKHMLEQLTGEEVRTIDLEEFAASMRHVEISSGASQIASTSSGQAGWGVEYDYHATYEEFEQTTFSAAGIIQTEDGQQISFTLDLQMTRSYREETNLSVRAGDALRKDPLVVNFGGTAAQLADLNDRHFRFDLDGDGKQESLPLFASGSGYLALDLDGNGKIDSGRELFGPGTGNGFKELARFDEDGNGWIDENDAVFDELEVWTPAAEGGGELQSLAELGVGALGLAHVATPFALRGGGNTDLGVVKASGVYLTESGQAGSLQEIDLTV